ncbi:transketolase A [Leptodontidium sp. MPI-SDFR-AT-0119]|nr:transketolase A [Leptodontidium sp. MPI-SDFR-AT-0119]
MVLKNFRLLVADLCQQFGGVHPGLWVLLMNASIIEAPLAWQSLYPLKRSSLSISILFLHLSGYKNMTADQLRSYHSERPDALCPGHPEIEHDGIELTTGPLGQGIASAVGLAIASRHLATTYNRPGFEVITNHTWCTIGDACLQDGVALEAMSLAGHLKNCCHEAVQKSDEYLGVTTEYIRDTGSPVMQDFLLTFD